MSKLVRTARKFFVSAFVISTFVAYVWHERLVTPAEGFNATTAPVAAIVRPAPVAQNPVVSPPSALPTTANQPVLVPTPTPQTAPTSEQPAPMPTLPAPANSAAQVAVPAVAEPSPTPTDQPSPTPTTEMAGLYKDGTYTGQEANAEYGWVQVQVVIQQGQIANVQFLEYPQDRRTSARINSRAVPALQSEAMQAQNANVDIVSGATLTSEAFIQSLASALDAAKA